MRYNGQSHTPHRSMVRQVYPLQPWHATNGKHVWPYSETLNSSYESFSGNGLISTEIIPSTLNSPTSVAETNPQEIGTMQAQIGPRAPVTKYRPRTTSTSAGASASPAIQRVSKTDSDTAVPTAQLREFLAREPKIHPHSPTIP